MLKPSALRKTPFIPRSTAPLNISLAVIGSAPPYKESYSSLSNGIYSKFYDLIVLIGPPEDINIE